MITSYIDTRIKLIKSFSESDYYIPNENPLFEYFSKDERAEGVIISGDGLSLVGAKEVDETFEPMKDESKYACPSAVFSTRKCQINDAPVQNAFSYPLNEEIKLLTEYKKDLYELAMEVVSNIDSASSEKYISGGLRDRLCERGFRIPFDPIVAVDGNSKELWHKPGDSSPRELIYIEVTGIRDGLTSIFSETFLLKEAKEMVSGYSKILEGIEFLRKHFLAGNSLDALDKLESLRNQQIYLTVPLFPFKHLMIPGETQLIEVHSTSIFDLWVLSGSFSIRKKVIAIAGSKEAMII